MKKNLYWVLTAVVLMFALGWTGYGQKQSTRKASWEYLTVSTGDAKYRDDAGLNALGAQGWELASAGTTDNAGNVLLYFKRAK